jgi:hypothetical protein
MLEAVPKRKDPVQSLVPTDTNIGDDADVPCIAIFEF